MVEKFLFCLPLAFLYHLVGAISILYSLFALYEIFLRGNVSAVSTLVPEVIIMALYILGFCVCSENQQARVSSLKGFAYIFLLLTLALCAAHLVFGCLLLRDPQNKH